MHWDIEEGCQFGTWSYGPGTFRVWFLDLLAGFNETNMACKCVEFYDIKNGVRLELMA